MADHVKEGVIKVIEVVGVSQTSWSDAARRAVEQASETVRGINGVEVVKSSARVENGQITEYHVDLKLAFPVERGGSVS